MTDAVDALERLKTELAWRGPNGKAMGHAMLPRHQAEALVELVEDFAKEYALDHGVKALRERFGVKGIVQS